MQEKGSRVGLSLACVAGALLTVVAPGVAMGTDGSARVITLQCPQDVKQADAMCQSVADALARRSAASVVRAMQNGDGFEPRAGDLRVALRVHDASETTISAHLEWRQGDASAMVTGPVVDFAVMDTTLRPAVLQNFADGLVSASPALLEILP